MKEFDEILRSDSGYVSCGSYDLLYSEGFPFWNYEVILREFSSRYLSDYISFSFNSLITTVIILFSIPLPSIHTHEFV